MQRMTGLVMDLQMGAMGVMDEQTKAVVVEGVLLVAAGITMEELAVQESSSSATQSNAEIHT